MRSTTFEMNERFEIGLVYKMSDDQGAEYFSSAEGVRWLASDWLEKWHNGGLHCTDYRCFRSSQNSKVVLFILRFKGVLHWGISLS